MPVPRQAARQAATLTATGRRLRVAVGSAALLLLLVGTAWGGDEHFPFGPFRMYATADDPDGEVASTYLRAVDAEGAVVERVGEREVGLRRAEYEGQVPRIVDDPGILADLADTFSRRHPDRPEWVEVSVVRTRHRLVDGRPAGSTREVLVTWRRP